MEHADGHCPGRLALHDSVNEMEAEAPAKLHASAGTPPEIGLSQADVREVYRRYGFLLKRRCQGFLRNPTLADDALQEAFLKLLRIGGSYKYAKEPLRWLYRLIDNTCLDQLRRGRRLRLAEPIDNHDVMLAHPNTDPMLRRAALDILAILDAQSAQIAILAFVDGMTQEEIAAELGLSRVTINKRIAQIREQVSQSQKTKDSSEANGPEAAS